MIFVGPLSDPQDRVPQDAFLIVCTIVAAPTLPTSPPLPHLLVPKTLIHAYASLFDDPDYSDVVFRIRPERTSGTTARVREKRLYAAKKVLAGRSEYFDISAPLPLSSPRRGTEARSNQVRPHTVFSSAFSEATLTRPITSRRNSRPTPTTNSAAHPLGREQSDVEDSDDDELDESDGEGCDEDDDSGVDESDDEDAYDDIDDEGGTFEVGDARALAASVAPPTTPGLAAAQVAFPSQHAGPAPAETTPAAPEQPRRSRTSSMNENSDDEDRPAAGDVADSSAQDVDAEEDDDDEEEEEEQGRPSTPRGSASRFVDAPTSAPASPARPVRVEQKKSERKAARRARGDDRPRFEVIVTDAACVAATRFPMSLHC